MKKVLIILGLLVIPTTANAAPPVKVTLCHATASATNPYNTLSVDVNSVVKEGTTSTLPVETLTLFLRSPTLVVGRQLVIPVEAGTLKERQS